MISKVTSVYKTRLVLAPNCTVIMLLNRVQPKMSRKLPEKWWGVVCKRMRDYVDIL